MRNAAIASLLFVAIVVGAGAGYFIGYSNERTVTTTVSETPPNSYVTTNAIGSQTPSPTSSTGTTYSTTSTYSISYVSIPPIKYVFEVNGTLTNDTLWELPANTTIWETFTLNNTSSISMVEAGFDVTSSSVGSTIRVGVYVNGELTKSSSYSIQSPSEINGSVSSNAYTAFPVIFGREFPRGTSITVAVVCSDNLYTYMYRTGVSFENPSPTLPSILSTSSASTREPFQFWALGTAT
jgi:hypothetical protein